MQRFVLRENIKIFEARLAAAADPSARERLAWLLAATRRELALLEAEAEGVFRGAPAAGEPLEGARADAIADFRNRFARSPKLAALIDPGPGLPYVEVNPAYEAGSGRTREALVGQALFTMFPDNPDDPSAEGMYVLLQALRQVSDSRRPVVMPVFRYDVADADGRFVERYWRNLCEPLIDAKGRLLFIRLLVDEATDEVRSATVGSASSPKANSENVG